MENITDEMLQAIAFEAAKIAVQTKAQISCKNVGESLNGTNLALMMVNEYKNALFTLKTIKTKSEKMSNQTENKRILK